MNTRGLFGAAQHWLGGLASLFRHVADPRQPALILYPVVPLALAGMLMYAMHLKARRLTGCNCAGTDRRWITCAR